MTHPWLDVDPAPSQGALPRSLRAVIEIPQGATNKYELDKATGLLRLDRPLHSAVHYPANYGFVPRTLAEDGDPLDVLVLCAEPIEPLCLVEADVIGLMTMLDEGQPDHKILATLSSDPEHSYYRDISKLPPHRLRMLERFFEEYKILEGKSVAVDPMKPAHEAHAVIEDALARFAREVAPQLRQGGP